MKKIISVALAVSIMLLACSAAFASADNDTGDISEYPVIIVAGYASSSLVVTNEDGTEEKCWYPDFDDIKAELLRRIAEIGIGLGAAAFNSPEYLADLIGEEFVRYTYKTACNDDGSSKYPTRLMFDSAEKCSAQYYIDNYDGEYQFEIDFSDDLLEYIPADRLFSFNVDWRMGAVYCATCLDDFIQQVKELCSCDKVNIFSLSHGGQVTGTYLSLFGYKQDVDNAVLTVPALGGAGVMYDLMTMTVEFDELNLLYFIEHGMRMEDDIHWLVEAQQLGFLDKVINLLLPYLFEVAGNWGSVWDFIPTDIYEAMKEKWLDPVKNAMLIEKSDYMHYTVMPSFYTELDKCNTDYGMNVSIIAGTDINMTTGCPVNGDGIIFTKSSTGADCTDFGYRFPDGYVQKNECGGKHKLSPGMTIDASTAYMPDHTWFVSGLFHGMMVWDTFTRSLQFTLLMTDRITDVYSDPDYPQFHTSTNASYAVHAAFDKSAEGFVSSEDSALILKNLSVSGKSLRIIGVSCSGMDLDFKLKGMPEIKAGETLEVPFTGEIPAKSNARADITVTYCVVGSYTPVGERTMGFTVLNGDVTDSGGDSAVPAGSTPFDSSVFSFMTPLLKKAGIYSAAALFYNIIYSVLLPIFRFIHF